MSNVLHELKMENAVRFMLEKIQFITIVIVRVMKSDQICSLNKNQHEADCNALHMFWNNDEWLFAKQYSQPGKIKNNCKGKPAGRPAFG
jgi:hypothetical protein